VQTFAFFVVTRIGIEERLALGCCQHCTAS
jgi:hypothetical protein